MMNPFAPSPESSHSADSHHNKWFSRTVWTVGVISVVVLAVMVGRVAQLQLAPSSELQQHIVERTTTKKLLPIRGDILDRRGRLLSATRFGERVYVDPTMLPSPPDETIMQLAKLTGMSEADVGAKIMKAVEFNSAYYAENPIKREAADEDSGSLKKLIERKLIKNGPVPGDVDPIVESADGVDTAAEGATTAVTVDAEKNAKKRPIRFVPLTGVVSEEVAQAVREAKIPGVALEDLPVREYPGGATVASIIGKVGTEQKGLMGTELLADKPLAGSKGTLEFVRDARGRPLWTDSDSVRTARQGNDIRMTIDLELQRIATQELMQGIEDCDAAGGRLILADPHTGSILAMVDIVRDLPGLAEYPWVDKPNLAKGQKAPPEPKVLGKARRYVTLKDDDKRKIHPALARNRCVEDIYEPGSTFKPFVWAVITELGYAKMEEVFDTEGGRWRTSYGRYIEDVTKRQTMTWPDVLKNSSNIGMIKAAERMSFAELHATLERFGFGKKTGIGLPGEASGLVTSMQGWSKYTQTSVAYGHEVAVTPVQMIQAFSVFAREGEQSGTMPHVHLVEEVASGDPTTPSFLLRVIPPSVAKLAREPMAGVVTALEERWIKPPEGGWRYRLYGKSGTAEIPLGKAPEGKKRPKGSSGYFDDQYNSSFIAAGPIESPRLVCLVVIDDPGPERVHKRSHYGAATAGPVMRRFMERALAYVGAPVSVREEPDRRSARGDSRVHE